MTLQTISKTAVERTLKLIRLPADAALRAAPEGRVRSSFGQALDRADAAVRQAAGNALRDEQLKDEAARLRSAVAEREPGGEPYADPGARTRRSPRSGAAAAEASQRAAAAAAKSAKRRKRVDEKQTVSAAEEAADKSREERVEALQDQAEELGGPNDGLELKEAAERARTEARRSG